MPTRSVFVATFALVALVTVAAPAVRAESPGAEPCTVSAVDLEVWLASSDLPTKVGGDSTDCDFNRFAWRSFLALMHPDSAAGRTFLGWKDKWALLGNRTAYANMRDVPDDTLVDYVEAGPNPNPLVDLNGEWTYYDQRVNPTAAYFLDACGLTTPDCLRAMTLPLGSSAKIEFPIVYPTQSVELKEAWKVMGEGDDPKLFVTRPGKTTIIPAAAGTVASARVEVGLTGLHIVHLTPNQQAWTWSSFEHVDNAPDCDEVGDLVGGDRRFNYFDPRCVARCRARRQNAAERTGQPPCTKLCGELNTYHNNGCPLDTKPSPSAEHTGSILGTFPCGGNLSSTCTTSKGCFVGRQKDPDYYAGFNGTANCFRADVSLDGPTIAAQRAGKPGCDAAVPTQVCRAWPVGFRGVTVGPGGAVKPKIDTTLGALNRELARLLGESGFEWAEVLANYRLVGLQWGSLAKGASEPILWSEQIDIQGDPTLVNVTLEAYIQGGGLPTDRLAAIAAFSDGTARGGCLACHGTGAPQFSWDSFNGVNFRPWRQQHFSHVLDYLAEPAGEGNRAACVSAVVQARKDAVGDPWKTAILDQCPIGRAAGDAEETAAIR